MGASDRGFSRTIPKEDVGDVSTWQFQALSGKSTAGARANGAAAAFLTERERRAYDRGRADGTEEGRRSMQHEKVQASQRIDSALAELRARFADLEANGADTVFDFAVEIARQVIRRDVAMQRDSVLPALREAVAAVIDQQAHPRVHLNPRDLEAIGHELESDGLFKGCRFIPDPAVGPGGCRVETAQCEVDATLQTRWRRVMAALGVEDKALDAPDKQ